MSERSAAIRFGPRAVCGSIDMGWTNAKVAIECDTLDVGDVTMPATSYGIFRAFNGWVVRRGPDVVHRCASKSDAWDWIEAAP